MKNPLTCIFLMSLTITMVGSQGTPATFNVDEAIDQAIEHDEWQMIVENLQTIVDRNDIPLMADAIRARYRAECSSTLVEKIIGDFYNAIGMICYENENYAEAEKSFAVACSTCIKYDYPDGIMANLINQGMALLALGDTALSVDRFAGAIVTAVDEGRIFEDEKRLSNVTDFMLSLDRISPVMEKAINLCKERQDGGVLQIGAVHFLGAIYFSDLDSLEPAAKGFQLAVDLFDRVNYAVGKMYSTFALVELYRRMGKPADSLNEAYGKAAIAALSNDSLEYLKNVMDAWREFVQDSGAEGGFENIFGKTIDFLSENVSLKDLILAETDYYAVANEMLEWDAENTVKALNRSLDFWQREKNIEKQVDILVSLAQKQLVFGENEKAISDYTDALRICLSGSKWQKAQALVSAIGETDLHETVYSRIRAALSNAEEAMLYVLVTGQELQWDIGDRDGLSLSDSLECALKIFRKVNDVTGMVITERLLGDVKCYFGKRVEGEQYYWAAFCHATEMNDTLLAQEAISGATDQAQEPAVHIDAFDTYLKMRQNLEPWASRDRMYVADAYRRGAENYYNLSRDIFTACAETLASFDDPGQLQLAFRMATMSLYTGHESDSFARDTLKSYRPTATVEDLKHVTFAAADSLYMYLDDLLSSCKLRGTDRWCLNYLEMLRGYVGLGCGNVLRILADHEYQLASIELKREWDTIDFMTDRRRTLEILLQRMRTYIARLQSDSIVKAYYEFQAKLSGRTYRSLPYESREQLGELIADAQDFKRSANARMLKYDLLGFADRIVNLGGEYGAGSAGALEEIPDLFGKFEFKEIVGAEEFIMPIRFDYLDARPVDWDQKRLAGIANTIASWKQNLYWDTWEREHWDLIDILLKIEMDEYKAADSLIGISAGNGSISKWVKAFYQYVHAELDEVFGRFQEALDSYDRANLLVQGLDDNPYMKACIVGNNGNLWLRLGDDKKAGACFDSAMYTAAQNPALKLLMTKAYISRTNLKLIRAIPEGDTATLNMAVNAYGSALSTLADIDEPHAMLCAKINLAVAYTATGDLVAADSVLSEVIEYARAGGFLVPLAGGRVLRGYVLYLSGKYDGALECCSAAANVYREVGDRYALSCALAILGRITRRIGDNENALKYLKESIDIFEAVRVQINADDISNAFTEANTDRYGEIISLLVSTGRTKEAFEYIERSKAKSLKDAVDIARVETDNARLGEALTRSKELEAAAIQCEKELVQERSRSPDLVDSAKIALLSKILAETKSDFIKCGSDVRRIDPDYEALVKVTPAQLAKIQPLITPHTLFLEYYAAQDSVFIFEVSRNSFKVRAIQIKKDSLYALVRKFRAMMSEAALAIQGGAGIEPISSWDAPGEDILPLKNVLSALYDVLISPVADDVVDVDNLVVIPSGLLSYLPFHALAHDTEDGYRFLVEEKNISYLSASELIDIAKDNLKNTKPSSFLGFANPDGSLPSALGEVEAIKAIFPRSEIFARDEATEDNACRMSANYNVLHFATHAMLDENIPDESYILLAKGAVEDGKWFMAEIYGQTWEKVDLVVLSACETALGEKDPGREVGALAYAFSVAGTPSVVASLWPVFDPSTQELMKSFYEKFKKESKTASLRSAQVLVLHNPQYAHPFYWAPFILIGDWR